jgi:hypothetical protein
MTLLRFTHHTAITLLNLTEYKEIQVHVNIYLEKYLPNFLSYINHSYNRKFYTYSAHILLSFNRCAIVLKVSNVYILQAQYLYLIALGLMAVAKK